MLVLIFSIIGGCVCMAYGWTLEMLSKECEVSFYGWSVFIFICGVLLVVAGVVDFIVTSVRRSRHRNRDDRITTGKYVPSERNGRTSHQIKLPGSRGKK